MKIKVNDSIKVETRDIKDGKTFRIYHQSSRYAEPVAKIVEDESHFDAAYNFFATIWKLRDKQLEKEGYKLVVVRMSGNEGENGTFTILQGQSKEPYAYEVKDSLLVELLDSMHADTSKLLTHKLGQD